MLGETHGPCPWVVHSLSSGDNNDYAWKKRHPQATLLPIATYPPLVACRIVRKHVLVCFSGDGGRVSLSPESDSFFSYARKLMD